MPQARTRVLTAHVPVELAEKNRQISLTSYACLLLFMRN